ncbi:MAG TPA: hypothetical protein VGR30_02375 [Candidatus Binatia bacterium]|jgi:hypothetical protein|nr:hypothetical protein [Candidatus Binatia bacterium]
MTRQYRSGIVGRVTPWLLRWSVLFSVLVGIACRLSQYAANTSIWHDEAAVAINVVRKSVSDLLGPLVWETASPPGFLVLERLVVLGLGTSEYILRLIPQLAGLAGLIGFVYLARRMCGTELSWLWAVSLMAASAKLIVQANEVKHFTLDLFWTVLVLGLATRLSDRSRTQLLLLSWGLVGALGLWFSYASLFVFSATSVVLGIRSIRFWDSCDRAAYICANVLALCSLALLMGSIEAQRGDALMTFWAGWFPDLSGPLALFFWLARSLLGLFNYFWQPLGAALLALAFVGSVRLWHNHRSSDVCFLLLPLLIALVAAFFHRWPFGGNQHMVFAAPAVFLLAAEGVETVRQRLMQRRQWLGWAFVAVLLLPNVSDSAYRIFSPRQRHEVRPVIEHVQRSRKPGDKIIVFDPATVEFYTDKNFRNPSLEPSRSTRVWVIATRSGYKEFPSQVEDLLQSLRSRRQRLSSLEEFGAAAYLFSPEQDSIE